jgi:hypothetical protein
MADSSQTSLNGIPTLLYHTILKVSGPKSASRGTTQQTYVLGTHTTLAAAKDFARVALGSLGYNRDEFEVYSERSQQEDWVHGDGMIVYCKAAGGEEFRIGIDTKPNNEALSSTPDGTLELPPGVDHLHYVLQTMTDYKFDGQAISTEIEGTYVKRIDAFTAALQCLVADDGSIKKGDYAQYDERDDLNNKDDWPFGEEAMVHAIAQTGENYLVEIKTTLGAHKHHKRHLK